MARDDCEEILLKTVVNRVRCEIMKVNVPFEDARYPVGLDKAVEDFETFLESAQVHQGIKIVGIAGMGGCGKTTLARKYCNLRYSKFQRYSFLSDVRKAALHDLQNKLLWDLVHLTDIPPSKDANELKVILAGRLRTLSARVLIVLDDVDQLDQFYALLPDEGKCLGLGSLIIVTTGDQSILQPRGISIYNMKALDPCHAKELFCWHAFLETSPPAAFEDLVLDFLDACDGLPLFIEVIGGMLCGKPEEEWRSKLNKISKLNRKEIQKLRTIYDALDPAEKYAFLDVACFFVGENINLAIAVWDADDREGLETLENLKNKCLIKVDRKNRIRMNSIICDLGRQIAIESWPHRIWSPEHINRLIECREESRLILIRGIMAATTQFDACPGHNEFPKCTGFYPPPFEECMDLRSLQLLVVSGNYFTSKFAELSKDLVWLRWFDFQHTNIPSWLSMPKLRVLELYGVSSLQDLWENNAHPPQELREMIISAGQGSIFHRFPSKMAGLEHLTKIALISYHGEEFCFTKLPDEFCHLQSLKHLELRHCKLLSELPIHFGVLRKLQYLDLCCCKTLRELPDSFKQLLNLEYLDLSGCQKLALKPDILVNIRKLENLHFSGCLQIAEQKSLRELHLKKTMLKDVPNNIGQLGKLDTLVIGSPQLTGFPGSLGYLSSLTRLKITGCIKLESLPESVERLNLLEYLCIKSSGVRSLPEGLRRLTNLQRLKIIDCPIDELDFGSGSSSSLGKLEVIHLRETFVTRLSISQDCCPKLETLHLEHNYSLMEIDIFLKSVKMVIVHACTKLRYINGIPGQGNPVTFEVTECPELVPHTITAPTKTYDALNEEEKQMFLDTACFFIGEEKSLAIAVWDGSGWSGLQGWESLINKDLVYLDENNRIGMHDHLRDLGRGIADQQSPPYRLWSSRQFNQLQSEQQDIQIRGMVNATCANSSSSQGKISINTNEGFRSLTPSPLGLKIFVGSGQFLNQEVGELSRELLWIRWDDFNHTNLPAWLSLKNLRVLELNGALNLRELWTDDAHAPLQLRELIIAGTWSASFQGFPSSISCLKHLKKIALLGDAGKEFGIKRLPDEFCRLQSLEHLELRHCTLLSALPAQFGDLINLQHLNLRYCKTLRSLPVSFEKLPCLDYLDLSGCKRLLLKEDILENITKLKNLYLSGCLGLQKLPYQITDQSCLRELQLQQTSLENFPRNIEQLSKLEVLTIGSPLLKRLPDSLGNLCSLKRLSIIGCVALKSLPKTLGHLELLEHLYIKGTKVKSLPQGFKQLANLQTLMISDCPLRHLDFGSVSCLSLEKLTVIKLRETLVTRISISEHCCPRLTTLRLSKNDYLEEIETLSATVNNIELSECEELKNIKGILALPMRPSLSISDCPKLPDPYGILI